MVVVLVVLRLPLASISSSGKVSTSYASYETSSSSSSSLSPMKTLDLAVKVHACLRSIQLGCGYNNNGSGSSSNNDSDEDDTFVSQSLTALRTGWTGVCSYAAAEISRGRRCSALAVQGCGKSRSSSSSGSEVAACTSGLLAQVALIIIEDTREGRSLTTRGDVECNSPATRAHHHARDHDCIVDVLLPSPIPLLLLLRAAAAR